MPKTLLQCELIALTPQLLVQCQPILVYDCIVDPKGALPSTAFRWMHIPFASRHSQVPASEQLSDVCRARYTLVWLAPATDGGRSIVRIADGTGEHSMNIMVARGQVLILPDGWRFNCATDTLDRYEMHDVASVFKCKGGGAMR